MMALPDTLNIDGTEYVRKVNQKRGFGSISDTIISWRPAEPSHIIMDDHRYRWVDSQEIGVMWLGAGAAAGHTVQEWEGKHGKGAVIYVGEVDD